MAVIGGFQLNTYETYVGMPTDELMPAAADLTDQDGHVHVVYTFQQGLGGGGGTGGAIGVPIG